MKGTPNSTRDFWGRVTKTRGCWRWTGKLNNKGYGRFSYGGRLRLAHRFAYELLAGPIPVGLTLDHLCRTPVCVNPRHLEPVTQRENMLRGTNPSAIAYRENRCHKGHPFTPGNTYVRSDGKRLCRACARERDRVRYAANPAPKIARAAAWREAHR